ncbi:MAG: PP2C family protein-serine/threonine phosphatase [Sphaerochaetaceae bacterium]|nr:PP2C family protein-serine/threonine phosphatase [Sphaerochaetaceae bacterium]
MSRIKKLRSNMSINVTGAIVSLLLVFGIIVCLIGANSIISAFKEEYSTVTYHMAESAAAFVNGDNIDEYLAGEELDEYEATKAALASMCQNLKVSLIYVIQVDRNDYRKFKSVFNTVNNAVDDSKYQEWHVGHERDTTNDEYIEKYTNLIENQSPYETVFRTHTDDGSNPHMTTIVPVRDSNGEVVAFLCVQRPIREFTYTVKPFILLILLGAFILVIISSALASVFLKRAVVKPVETLSQEAKRFAKEHTIKEPLGAIGRYDTIRDLAKSIDSMEADMVSYVENLTAATAEREKISAELNIAAAIQQDALPKVFPAFPDRKEFDIYASMDPAKQVGGDFYNYLLIDDDHLALIIADVSDKGIPAALFMESANTLICDRAMIGGSPADIISHVNDSICMRNAAGMFVTVWLGILEISTGKLVSVNAGHEDPVICRKGGDFELIKEEHGLLVGGFEGVKYKNNHHQLHDGDILFLYTDGLPEASNSKGKMIDFDRMLEALNQHKSESPQGIVDGVRHYVSKFVGKAPQFDDLTILCVSFDKKGRS